LPCSVSKADANGGVVVQCLAWLTVRTDCAAKRNATQRNVDGNDGGHSRRANGGKYLLRFSRALCNANK